MIDINKGMYDKLTTIETTPKIYDWHTNVLMIKNYFFLPSVEIELVKTTFNDKDWQELRKFRIFKNELPVKMTGISLIFDLSKLRRYFTPQVTVEVIKDDNIIQHKGGVREC